MRCRTCAHWMEHDDERTGECTVKLPPWATGAESRATRHDDGCDLHRENGTDEVLARTMEAIIEALDRGLADSSRAH